MKNFIVTYRGKDGKQDVVQIAAEDRNGVFAELAKRGISAIKVEEAKGKAKPKKASSAKNSVGNSGLVLGIISGIAIIAIVAGLASLLYFQPQEEQDAVKKKPGKGKIEEVTLAPAASVKAKLEPEPKPVQPQEDPERARRREMFKNMSYEEKMNYLYERAKNTPLREEPSSNRIFRTSTEQVMDWIFRCEVGDPPPLLPKMSLLDQAHLAEILVSDNPIKDDDSERAKDAKETVQMVKKEFMAFIKEGGNPDDFLPYYHDQLVQAHEEWKMARKMAIDAVKQDPDIAAEFLQQVNERLSAKGIKNVTLPPKMLEYYGIELLD